MTHGLYILVIYYLSPNLLILTDEINVLEGTIFYGNDPNRFYIIIPFVFQILSMLFY